MMDRSTICGEICRRVRIKRQNPTRTTLTKREVVAVWRYLINSDVRIDQLESEVRALRSTGATTS
jgi:hypothetical protein